MCLASTVSGGLGEPSDPTMGVCLRWLDADRTNVGESLRDQGGQKAPVRARKHGPRAKNRRGGALEGERPTFRAHAARRGLLGSAFRRSAPSDLVEGEEE